MKQGTRWGRMGAVMVAAAALLAVLLGAQFSQQSQPMLLDLYNLLVTEEGENRIVLLHDRLDAIEAKLDLIHSVTLRTLEEQYGLFEGQEWILEDMKFLLEGIDRQLDTIEDYVD